jgi:ABC-2 type transport system ATP-binding protein
MLFCGIDIAKHKHAVLVVDDRGQIVEPAFSINNSRAGFEQLAAALTALPDPVTVGLEATGHYWLALYDDLTGEENLRFFGRLAGLDAARLRERVDWSLEFVLLTERARDRVKTYSGGMKRRLNLAVALIHDPPLLLLDEPTVGVDPQSRNVMFDRILELKSNGRSIVYTTHYMEEAERLCDRVGIIDRGRLLALDTVDALIDQHGGKSVVTACRQDGQVRVESTDPIGEVVKLHASGGIVSLRIDRPNLERVFLNLTGRELRD